MEIVGSIHVDQQELLDVRYCFIVLYEITASAL